MWDGMTKLDSKKMAIFVSFLNQLARELTSYYKTKLDKLMLNTS